MKENWDEEIKLQETRGCWQRAGGSLIRSGWSWGGRILPVLSSPRGKKTARIWLFAVVNFMSPKLSRRWHREVSQLWSTWAGKGGREVGAESLLRVGIGGSTGLWQVCLKWEQGCSPGHTKPLRVEITRIPQITLFLFNFLKYFWN